MPTPADAFGALLHDEFQFGQAIEIIERDDGFLATSPAAHYFAEPEDWPGLDHRAVARCRGRVLDVGAGGGRVALELQRRGHAVTALDSSPGAVAVLRERGVTNAVCATPSEHSGQYDTLLLLGNGVGLFGGRRQAPLFLAALAALAAPGARLVAHGMNMPLGPDHQACAARNLADGEFAGLMRVRVRHRSLVGAWFDFLYSCPPDDLAALLPGTGWRLDEVDNTDAPMYLAVFARD